MVPYLLEGLERGERAIFFGAPPQLLNVGEALVAAGVDLQQEQGRVRLLLAGGLAGEDEPETPRERLRFRLTSAWEAASRDGFSGIRIAADIAWLAGSHRAFDDLPACEVFIEEFVAGKPVSLMCQYSQEHCPPEVLVGVLRTHRQVVIDGRPCPNLHYQPPELRLESDAGIRATRTIQWMRAQLSRASQAEAAARLAGEIAHDLNNLLTVIQGNCEIALDDPEPAAEGVRDALREIQGAARRAALLTRRLLGAAGPRESGTPENGGGAREGGYDIS